MGKQETTSGTTKEKRPTNEKEVQGSKPLKEKRPKHTKLIRPLDDG